ncbi:MAG TPA: riboflavin synthase [Flavobacteriales bacterium]|jgi:riboflavin synthase
MFSGIVEAKGIVQDLVAEQSNLHLIISCPFTQELKIDQSVAHNGVCLTVVKVNGTTYTVTAIEETLRKTNLGSLKKGDIVNLERCIRLGDRIDGHMVQGHVDTTATCTGIEDQNGSWKFSFQYEPGIEHITVPKGSICINGVSLTVVDSTRNAFSVCIIPYTFEHTNFSTLKVGDKVNLEFDIIGKYVARYMELGKP